MITKNRRNLVIFTIPFVLLSIPLIAMQFSKKVDWSLSDFAVAGVLLFGTAFIIKMILEKFKSTKSRLILVGTTLVILLLVWIELAVGILGSPFAGN